MKSCSPSLIIKELYTEAFPYHLSDWPIFTSLKITGVGENVGK